MEQAEFMIMDYIPYYIYSDDVFTPFIRAIRLGPFFCYLYELASKRSRDNSTISGLRYWYTYRFRRNDVGISILSASLQVSFAIFLYVIPLIIYCYWRNSIIGAIVFICYAYVACLNFFYYFDNYIQWSL